MGRECAQLTNHSVGRPMYYIDEASGGVLRERDSQVTGFHSSHTPHLTCGLTGNGLSGTLFEVVRELAVDWLSVQWFMNIKVIR